MNRILKSNNGSTLIIVLMIVMVLGILIPVGYTWYNKMFLNENRLIHQKQAVNLSVSAMESFESQDQTEKISYLNASTYPPDSPLGVTKGKDSQLDLYQYAEDQEGNRLSKEELQAYTGEYEVIIRAISGDSNHDQQKSTNEPFFYEHEMTALETATQSEVVIEKTNSKGEVIETQGMTFQAFYDQYNNDPEEIIREIISEYREGSIQSVEEICNILYGTYRLIHGNVTIFSTGNSDATLNSLVIEATGSINLEGNYAIQTDSSLPLILFKSQNGDISINQTTLNSYKNIWGINLGVILGIAPKGKIKIENASLSAGTIISLRADSIHSISLKDNLFPSMREKRMCDNIFYWTMD